MQMFKSSKVTHYIKVIFVIVTFLIIVIILPMIVRLSKTVLPSLGLDSLTQNAETQSQNLVNDSRNADNGDYSEERSSVSSDTDMVFLPKLINRSDIADKTITDLFKKIMDPEININIYDFGLVRKIAVDEKKIISVTLIYTSLICPFNDVITDEIKNTLLKSKLFKDVNVDIDKKELWRPEFLTPEGKSILKELYQW